MSWEPALPADATGPVTTTVTRRVKPGHEAAYEAFLAGISGAARAFPGYLGIEIFRPIPGGRGGEYRTVYCFDSAAHLRGWLDSPDRAAWLERAEPMSPGRCGPRSSPAWRAGSPCPPSPASHHRPATRWPCSPG